MPASEIVIASAKRTAVGLFNGAFGSTPAHDLGAVAIKGALEAAKVDASEVDEVILGQILAAGRPESRPSGGDEGWRAKGENGLRHQPAVWQRVARSRARAAADHERRRQHHVAGGQESMSLAPHAAYLRSGVKMGEMKLMDTMLQDGLLDAFHGYHMGNTAENIATKWQISREEQDRFAVARKTKRKPRKRPDGSRTKSFR